MVTEAELSKKVQEFLQSCDLKKTTNNIVIQKLQSDFGVDLSDQKPLLRYFVDRFLQSQYEFSEEHYEDIVVDRMNDENDDVSGDDDDEEEFCNNNGSNVKLKGFDKLGRPAQQNKENTKRTCFSGKYSTLSPELQKFLGAPHMTRTDVVKRLWAYVKEKGLQDPYDGKNIICDETLRNLLGADSINILQINKALTKHIWPPVKRLKGDKKRKHEKDEEAVAPLVKSLPKEKPRKQEREEDHCGDESKEKRQKKVLSGFLAPLPLSDTLIRFLGTGETALTRADVIKRVWDYIKHEKLQDPFDRKTIISDEKLKELFNVDTFHGFTVSKLLSPHFVKM
ncbi:hypothetical protein RND81_06G031200 [Saponaria officinalis]|uniref:Uncharacterized protein n=1 Tax=Saponaria officinalis TaxID=3572 RepID=A0AAW1K607_SAPOF